MTQVAILPKNHISFTSESDMRSLCQTTLAPFGITYFNYLRIYDDGWGYILSTRSQLVNYVFENKIPLAAPVQPEVVSEKFNYLILPVGAYEKSVHEVKVHFNAAHFINLVDRHNGYFDLHCFGSTANNNVIVNFYLNNMGILENFKFYFKKQAENLLKKSEKSKILIPESMRPTFKGLNSFADSTKENFSEPNNLVEFCKYIDGIPLSHRQLQIMQLTIRGKTAKEIAKSLNLSRRTVEYYLEIIKEKTNSSSKAELIERIMNNLFYNFKNLMDGREC